MDANADMDRSASRISSQMKNLVVHSSEDGYKAVTKFDEMMKRLKSTVAAHKLSIPNGEAIFEASLLSEPSDAKQV